MHGRMKDVCQPAPLKCIDLRFVLIVCFVFCPRHQQATVDAVRPASVCSVEQIRVVINLPENKLSWRGCTWEYLTQT